MSDWEEECKSPAGYDPDINSSSDYHSSRSRHARGGMLYIIAISPLHTVLCTFHSLECEAKLGRIPGYKSKETV